MADEESIESQIKVTMASRVPYFREQADSLTFEGVRRLLEKDLGLDKYALDVHKRFIKQLLSKYLEGNDEDNITKNMEEKVEKNVTSATDVAASSENNLADKDVKEPNIEDEGQLEDSPVMGLLTESKSTKPGVVETKDIQKNEIPSESTIKEAMSKKAAYFRANSETITMAGVRRLLEKDLELDEFTLDPVKNLIRQEVDKVFASSTSTLSTGDKKKSDQGKKSKNVNIGERSNSSDNGSDDMEDVPRIKVVRKEKVKTSKMLNKRKRPEKETKVSNKKQNKLAKMTSEESPGDAGGNDSEDIQSHSSEEKPVKRKEVSTPAYGKDVEHLKSIIKSCGMSVPPVVYKKAKQVPDNKREGFIIKELEKILEKEGLSRKPNEKEIKEVRKRKSIAKELEGIDMSNIVLSSRRRSTASFIPPPKPKTPVESDGDGTEDSDDGSDDDNSDDDNSDGEDNDVEEPDQSQNDELHEDDEDSN